VALLLSYNKSNDCFGKPDHKVFQSVVLFSKRFQRQIIISFKLIKRRPVSFLWRWLFHSVSTLKLGGSTTLAVTNMPRATGRTMMVIYARKKCH